LSFTKTLGVIATPLFPTSTLQEWLIHHSVLLRTMEMTRGWVVLPVHSDAAYVKKARKFKISPYPFSFSRLLAMVVPSETEEDPLTGARNLHFLTLPTAH
jgi:hypothetical protein